MKWQINYNCLTESKNINEWRGENDRDSNKNPI